MDVTDKIIKTLMEHLKPAYVRVDDEGGVSGFAVSPRFKGMSAVDRQLLLEDVLRSALKPAELRKILLIAPLTPAEYDEVGARIRVHKLKEMADGTIEVFVHGTLADAEYVRGALKLEKGVKTTEPEDSPGAPGVLMSFRAKGTPANPLTKQKARGLLERDRYMEIMPGA